MLNKNDLRNTLESIAISPLLQLSGTEEWKTPPADKISAPPAQLAGCALSHCVFFATATSAAPYCRLKASFCRSILYESLLIPTGMWLQVFGVWSISVSFHIVSAILTKREEEALYTQHLTTFLTFQPWLISTMGEFDAAQCAFQMYTCRWNDVTLACMDQMPSVSAKDHIRRSHYLI